MAAGVWRLSLGIVFLRLILIHGHLVGFARTPHPVSQRPQTYTHFTGAADREQRDCEGARKSQATWGRAGWTRASLKPHPVGPQTVAGRREQVPPCAQLRGCLQTRETGGQVVRRRLRLPSSPCAKRTAHAPPLPPLRGAHGTREATITFGPHEKETQTRKGRRGHTALLGLTVAVGAAGDPTLKSLLR